jgi:hypothetical protein
MPDMSVFGPFRESDFAEQDGLDPVNRVKLAGARAAHLLTVQHRFIDSESFQSVREGEGTFHGEARADLAGIGKSAVAIVAKIKRAERPATALGIAVAD